MNEMSCVGLDSCVGFGVGVVLACVFVVGLWNLVVLTRACVFVVGA